MSKRYLNFVDTSIEGRKTKRFEVINVTAFAVLGRICWFTRFRKYCFFPEPNMTFDAGCLKEIADELNALTDAHKTK